MCSFKNHLILFILEFFFKSVAHAHLVHNHGDHTTLCLRYLTIKKKTITVLSLTFATLD